MANIYHTELWGGRFWGAYCLCEEHCSLAFAVAVFGILRSWLLHLHGSLLLYSGTGVRKTLPPTSLLTGSGVAGKPRQYSFVFV